MRFGVCPGTSRLGSRRSIHTWQILRVTDGVQGHWTGAYKSAEDALATLKPVTERSTITVTPLDKSAIRRRQRNGQLFDVIEYPFCVSNGEISQTVWVGITGQAHDLATAFGAQRLSQDELIEAAKAWLVSRTEKGADDLFSSPDTDAFTDIPPALMSYWTEHRHIPNWV